jgi:hypothetical protein
VLFGEDWIRYSDLFPDGAGLSGGYSAEIELDFDRSVYWIAIDFVGIAQIALYRDGELIQTSSIYDDTVSTFGGLISTEPFDAAVIEDPSDPVVAIDNLHFGPPIPVPGVLAMIGLALFRPRRRRAG